MPCTAKTENNTNANILEAEKNFVFFDSFSAVNNFTLEVSVNVNVASSSD